MPFLMRFAMFIDCEADAGPLLLVLIRFHGAPLLTFPGDA